MAKGNKLKWCLRQKRGVSLVKPSENLADAYLAKSREALGVMRTLEEKSYSWAISSCYYAMYYSVYAILMRMGIKSEIHSCTIELMRSVLSDIYDTSDVEVMQRSFECRIENQYYTTIVPESEMHHDLFDHAPRFYSRAQEALISINEDLINSSRRLLQDLVGDRTE